MTAKKLIKYAIALAAGACITLLVAFSRGAFGQSDSRLLAQYLCDAFFVAGVALGGVGLLAFVASDGFFDMIGFGVKKVLSLLQRDDSKLSGTFFEYKSMKMARRGKGASYLLVVAALFLAAATFCLLIYNYA